jgi:hypothetical protein
MQPTKDVIRLAGECLFPGWGAQGAAPSFGVEISAIGVGSATEIERGITAFARERNGGLIVLPLPMTYATSETGGGLLDLGSEDRRARPMCTSIVWPQVSQDQK